MEHTEFQVSNIRLRSSWAASADAPEPRVFSKPFR